MNAVNFSVSPPSSPPVFFSILLKDTIRRAILGTIVPATIGNGSPNRLLVWVVGLYTMLICRASRPLRRVAFVRPALLFLCCVLSASATLRAQPVKPTLSQIHRLPQLRMPAAVGALALLIPDGMSNADPRVMAWLDAASEEGVRIDLLTDSQFLALGGAHTTYRGVLLPDGLHTIASDALIGAVRTYVQGGGQVMLVYDFGALTDAGTYAIPKSRLSALAGVDYILYDELRDQTIGLGPVIGFESALRSLQIPPGKSILFADPAEDASIKVLGSASRDLQRTPNQLVNTVPLHAKAETLRRIARETGALRHAALAPGEALYLPSAPTNVGGVANYDHAQQLRVSMHDTHQLKISARGPVAVNADSAASAMANSAAAPITAPPRLLTFAHAKHLPELRHVTPLNASHKVTAGMLVPSTAGAVTAAISNALTADPIEAVSGYIYGALTYPSFVTRGVFSGVQLANAPQFGLVAGVNAFGNGKVLFINTPLTFLKGRTDGMLMQGALHYFAVTMLAMPRLASVPNGRGGLTLNWHLCSNFTDAMQQLTDQGVFNYGPFSVHITAGPDTIAFGDGLGWDLPHNLQAQQMLRDLDLRGHRIGNHGGWIHDYYGTRASETNQSSFQQYLTLNKNAVDAALGHASVEYAAPVGDSPSWALDWLEQNQIVGTYYLGHTGLGATRNYINGVRRNRNLWVNPVTPLGLYATFEEFIFNNVPKQDVIDWYQSMVDFNVQNRSSRLIYMHPPGAAQWSDVVLTLLAYADARQAAGNFRWYTMSQIDNFMTARGQVAWTETAAGLGARQFHATHPTSLVSMSWVMPKLAYAQPAILAGQATVTDGGDSWLVTATAGRTLDFSALPL